MLINFIQYKLDATPTPSDEEDVSSDEEDDAFGPKKEKIEEDPVKSEFVRFKHNLPEKIFFRSKTNCRKGHE